MVVDRFKGNIVALVAVSDAHAAHLAIEFHYYLLQPQEFLQQLQPAGEKAHFLAHSRDLFAPIGNLNGNQSIFPFYHI